MTSCIPGRAGYLLGTTRARQPAESGADPDGRRASTSGGVCDSLPAQNGHGAGAPPAPRASRSVGRAARPGAMIVSLPLTGLRRRSPISMPFVLRRGGERYSESSEASSIVLASSSRER